jgi:serine/threonine-protein kinase
LSEDFPAQLAGFRAGSLMAGYRLEAQIGAGGMAVVFRALDERLGRLVALKILAPALAADASFRRRFIAESRAAAAVDDPHIIPVYEAGEAAGVLFIAMRFVRGGDLRQVLEREGPMPPGRVAAFVAPVASALDAAHRAGLVHRDVKPANILVDVPQDRPEHVYLSDFGVSKGAISSVSLTGTGHFVGTPDYSAPEQIQGRAVDGRTDQYALACVAYQLLTGATPFGRDQGMAVLLAHLSEPPPPLSSRRPDLPGEAAEVLARGMAKVPEKRYGSCRDFAEALREALGLTPYPSLGPAPVAVHPQTQTAAPRPELVGPDLAGTGKAAVLGGPEATATADWAPGREATGPADGPAAANDPGVGPAFTAVPFLGQDAIIPAGRRKARKAWALIAAAAVAVGLTATVINLNRAPPLGDADAARVYSGVSYGFGNPDAIAVDGSHVWVASLGGSVTELNAANGSRVRTLSGGSYGFSSPEGIAADGTHVWVTNLGGGANGNGSVTELNASNGGWVRTLSGGSYGFNGPWGIATDGTHVWVDNYGRASTGDSVTELNASNGSWVRTLHGVKAPYSLAVQGGHVWVANGDSVTELNADNGSRIRTLSGASYGFNGTQAIAVSGTRVWVANYGGGADGNGSVTELNASNGTVVQILSNASYGFDSPQGITVDGAHVWIADGGSGGSVTELNAGNGSRMRTLSGAGYGFADPWAIAVDGAHVWVANHQGNSVTELPTG